MNPLETISSYLGLPVGIPNDERLTLMIDRACDFRLTEPDMALNLDIAEHINKKKQNIPHDVSQYLVQLINNRDQKVAMLALILLDTCIRNCGYPFHLQIARKEFLNELVKKFPETPPPFPSSVQIKILEFINEWKLGLASQPRFKQDFKKISELHNIMLFKGYKFPNPKPERISTLISKQALSSAEELEEADREALSAKLQEHIRKGTPADLVKANELMKLLSGYDIDKRPDYQSLVERQLLNVERSIETLSERLVPGVEFDRGLQELFNECNSAQAKIQKLILEEEEGEHANRLFELNDKLNELNTQYENAKKGIFLDQPIYFKHQDSGLDRPKMNELNLNNNSSSIIKEDSNISLIDLGEDFMSSPSITTKTTLDPFSSIQESKSIKDINLNLLESLEGLNFNSQPSSNNSLIPTPNTPNPLTLNTNNSTPKESTGSSPNQFNKENDIYIQKDMMDLIGVNNNNDINNIINNNINNNNDNNNNLNEVKKKIILENECIKIETTAFIQEKIAYIQFNFFNLANFKMEKLDFKLAVPKGLTTVISGISSTYLLPKIGHVSLPVEIHFNFNSNEVKYRFIVSFELNGQSFTFNGEVKEI